MANPDLTFGQGDSLPLLVTTLIGSDGLPIVLTGKTTTLLIRATTASAPATIRPCTPDPDQVANPGKLSCKLFDVGVATPGDYTARFKVVDGALDQISVRNDRLLTIKVTSDP